MRFWPFFDRKSLSSAGGWLKIVVRLSYSLSARSKLSIDPSYVLFQWYWKTEKNTNFYAKYNLHAIYQFSKGKISWVDVRKGLL